MAKQAQNPMQPTSVPVLEFLDRLTGAQQRADAEALIALMGEISGSPTAIWGSGIVGFDSYHYRYESGREGDMCVMGFSPRKGQLSLYFVEGFERHADALARLGPHKLGKGCLYIKRLSDVDMGVLEAMLRSSHAYVKAHMDSGAK